MTRGSRIASLTSRPSTITCALSSSRRRSSMSSRPASAPSAAPSSRSAPRVERRQRDGAVHRARVEIGEPEPPGDLARDRALPAARGPVDRDDHRRKRRALGLRVLLALAVACAIRARLGAVSAHRHRAPRARPVARPVVERPLARSRPACLQALARSRPPSPRARSPISSPDHRVEPLAARAPSARLVARRRTARCRGTVAASARGGSSARPGRAARRCWRAAAARSASRSPSSRSTSASSGPATSGSPCSRSQASRAAGVAELLDAVLDDLARVHELADQLEPTRGGRLTGSRDGVRFVLGFLCTVFT